MGIIRIDMQLSNPRRPGLKPLQVQARVDAGADGLCIPEHLRIQLDLQELERREVTAANGKKEVVPYVGPVRISCLGRGCLTGALVLGDRVLLPAVPTGALDLLVISPPDPSLTIGDVEAAIPADILGYGEDVLLELSQGIHSVYAGGRGTHGYREQFGYPCWLEATSSKTWWWRHFAERATVYYTNRRIIFSGDSEQHRRRGRRRFVFCRYESVEAIRMCPRCVHCGFLASWRLLFPFLALANWLRGKIDLTVYVSWSNPENEFTITCDSREEARQALRLLQTRLPNAPFEFRTESTVRAALLRRLYNVRRRPREN
jgi:clan AA aspartic protease